MEPIAELPLGVPTTLRELGPIELTRVETTASSQRWRTLIATYHYLGYTPFAGAQLRYLVESSSGTLGAIGFAASAWACAPRDEHIGWDAATRKARLHLVVANARFLILPHVTVANLASHILGSVTRRLGSDWQLAYGYQPVLLETFVETGRFTGASYRAANWIRVGQTKGRGKLDRYNERATGEGCLALPVASQLPAHPGRTRLTAGGPLELGRTDTVRARLHRILTFRHYGPARRRGL